MLKKAPIVVSITPKNLTFIRKYYLNIHRITMATLVGINDYYVKKGETTPDSKEALILCDYIRQLYEKIKDEPRYSERGIILQ